MPLNLKRFHFPRLLFDQLTDEKRVQADIYFANIVGSQGTIALLISRFACFSFVNSFSSNLFKQESKASLNFTRYVSHYVAAAYNDRYNNRDDKATKPDNRDKFARLIFRTSRSLLFRSTVFVYSVHAHNS